MLGVVVSRADEASSHVGAHLLDLRDWDERSDGSRQDGEGGGTFYVRDGFELRTFDELHLYLEGVAAAFDEADAIVFVSRHSGETGPLLTAHFTGNFGAADYGGEPGSLARACPNALAAIRDALERHAPDGYDVGMECTHHGPSSVGAPSMYVEVGSDVDQWRDPDAARAVARAVLDLRDVEPIRDRTLVGFGGGHYVPRFERIVRETDWAVGHVAADWAFDDGSLERDVVAAAFERSAATRAVIDGERPDLARTIDDLGYRVVSETWVRETSGVPLELVERAEAALSTVDEGLRFGDARGEFEVSELDEELLADANGIDQNRVREVVASRAVAYETTEGGSLVDGRVAIPTGEFDALIDAFAALFADHYETVERREDELVVRERAFDPAAARALGVPEGPAFGRLANGRPVEVDGETITPDRVHAERTRRYPANRQTAE